MISDSSLSMSDVVDQFSRGIITNSRIIIPELSEQENTQLNTALHRLKVFGVSGQENGLHLLVDAEYTYMNKGISAFALAMMVALNRDKPVVWNTYQCYLKQALNTISSEMKVVRDTGACFGAKIVRGAYMEKEKKLAKKHGYEDPVNDSYEATGEMYNKVVNFMMDNIAQEITDNKINMVVATHNESGALHAARKMLDSGIPPDSGHVVFGQIYGEDTILVRISINYYFRYG